MKNRHVASAWVSFDKASGSNLHSDGRSMWSYGYYEIARHAGIRLAFIRDYDESFSVTTRNHFAHVYRAAALNAIRLVPVAGENGRGINADRLGQPDWSWLSLCHWFDTWNAKQKEHAWPGRNFLVSIREDAEITGRSHVDAALRFAKKIRDIVPLLELAEGQPGHGIVQLGHDAKGKSNVRRASIHLEKLDLVYPSIPPSFQVAAKHREGPHWFNRLFWDVEVKDIRRMGFLHTSATEFGEPPEPILPFWSRVL